MPTRPQKLVSSGFGTVLLPCAILTACFHPAARTFPPGPVESRVGVVRAIGADQRFVLIETSSALAASALAEGQLLHGRPPDATSSVATADFRVSRERQEALIVANVVAGIPVTGAIVYSTPADAASPAPTTRSGASVPTAALPGLLAPKRP